MDTNYTLPDLPFDYSALEPHLSGQLIELHHDKHHRSYVEGANKTLDQLAEARQKKDFTRIAGLEQALAFNLSGHVLHSLFWQNLTPGATGRPQGELASAIQRDLGGFDAFRAQMIQAASTTMGSGWAMLAWEPLGRRLVVLQVHDHDSRTSQGSFPLLVLDAWEHAYYIQYRAQKSDYFDAVWNLWNWEDVAARHAVATRLDIGLSVGRAPELQPAH